MSNDENKELRERVATLERLLLEQRSLQPGMPVDPDVARRRHEEIRERLEGNHRAHVARTNRAKGHPDPKPGDVYYGWLAKQVRGGVRSREGLDFAQGQNVKIEVVDNDEAAAKERRVRGERVVTPAGMERIFEDDTLVINRDPHAVASEDLAAERARADAAEARAAAAEQRLAELESAARRNATDPGDGSPGRLKAAQKVRADADKTEVQTLTGGKGPDKG